MEVVYQVPTPDEGSLIHKKTNIFLYEHVSTQQQC